MPGAMEFDLFFVISGFIMFSTTGNMATGQFWKRRAIRIMPLYFLLTTVAFVYAKIWPSVTGGFSSETLDYVRSIAFIPFENAKLHTIQPILAQGWTLNYEMFFYLCFGLTLLIAERWRLLACTIAFVCLIAIGQWTGRSGPLLQVYTDPLMFEFLFGMGLGNLYKKKPEWLVPAAFAIIVVWAVAALSSGPRFLSAGLLAAAFIGMGLCAERARAVPVSNALLLLGDASYSLYLAHGFVLGRICRVWKHAFDIHRVATNAGFVIVATATAIGVAIMLYLFVERPITQFFLRMTAPRQGYATTMSSLFLNLSRPREIRINSTALQNILLEVSHILNRL